MSFEPLWQSIQSLLALPLVSGIFTTIISATVAAYVGLWTFRHQSKELVDGATTWQWTHSHTGLDEEPYLVIQNRSAFPAFIVRARYLSGLFIRTETDRYPFNYADPTQDSYPLTVKAGGVTSFPLSLSQANRIVGSAPWFSRWFGYLLKRNYLWVEVVTMSGRRLMIPANDATSFNNRPLWLEGRWFPRKKPDWMTNGFAVSKSAADPPKP